MGAGMSSYGNMTTRQLSATYGKGGTFISKNISQDHSQKVEPRLSFVLSFYSTGRSKQIDRKENMRQSAYP